MGVIVVNADRHIKLYQNLISELEYKIWKSGNHCWLNFVKPSYKHFITPPLNVLHLYNSYTHIIIHILNPVCISDYIRMSWSFLFCAFSYSNDIFNFPTKSTCTIEYLYCLLNVSYTFQRSLRHPQGDLLSLLKTICFNNCKQFCKKIHIWYISCSVPQPMYLPYNKQMVLISDKSPPWGWRNECQNM